MNSINIFAFESDDGAAAAVRVVMRDGEPWFVAVDVCRAIGLSNPTRALERPDDDEHTLSSTQGIHVGAGNPSVSLVNEPGLYTLVLASRKPEAKRFRRWLTHEVLPSIRKTGAYIGPAATRERLVDPPPRIPAHQADRIVAAARTFNALVRAGQAAGLPRGQAIRRAAEVAQRESGVDLLNELGAQDLLDSIDAARQKRREAIDPWFDRLALWLDSDVNYGENGLKVREIQSFTSFDLLTKGLNVPMDRIDGWRQMATRVGIVMHRLGWEKRRDSNGARVWRYWRPATGRWKREGAPGGPGADGRGNEGEAFHES